MLDGPFKFRAVASLRPLWVFRPRGVVSLHQLPLAWDPLLKANPLLQWALRSEAARTTPAT